MLDFLIKTVSAQVRFPSIGGEGQDLAGFIVEIYNFAFAIVGLAIFIQFLRAGFGWLTAAGNTSKIGNAREMMLNAIIGAIVLFSSWMILNVINPDLVKNTFRFGIISEKSENQPIPGADEFQQQQGLVIQTQGGESIALRGVVSDPQGSYNFIARVSDSDGNSTDTHLRIDVDNNETAFISGQEQGLKLKNVVSAAVIQVNPPFLKRARVGLPYDQELEVTGGVPPFVWEIVEGRLPDGVVLVGAFSSPVITISNLTAARSPSYVFLTGDRFKLELSNGAPNSAASIMGVKNGASAVPSALSGGGTVDSEGKWSAKGGFTSQDIGQWHLWVVVDGKISNILSFEILTQEVGIRHSTDISGSSHVSGTSSFIPCTDNLFCENRDTGERYEPGNSGCQGEDYYNRNPGVPREDLDNTRQVNECLYPDQNPSDPCLSLWFHWRNCNEEISKRLQSDGSVDTTGLADNPNGEPGDPWVFANDRVRCTYPDQEQAINCGMPGSGEYCLPGYTPEYCADAPL